MLRADGEHVPMTIDRIELNGEVADAAALARLAQVNYGHFTSMQVRDGGVRGLDLHLARLDAATRELFGMPLEPDTVRLLLRQAIAGDADMSLRVTVFSRAFDRTRPERTSAPDVLVAASDPRGPHEAPLRLRAVAHERAAPHIKHVGTFDLFHRVREARLAGADDVLFTTRAGAVSEASIWNVGFRDGARVVWPNAPALHGITQQVITRGLRARGIEVVSREITLDDAKGFRTAFVCNSSTPACAIAAIDGVVLARDEAALELVRAAYASQPLERP
ncbi:aminotransferase class IV [Dokdonella sp. MW10]|uniref:aminotransferase class IV n=1 Tax=Dokdonella sp. MW10 TaxID=2992926 RepID=UPI003F80751B